MRIENTKRLISSTNRNRVLRQPKKSESSRLGLNTLLGSQLHSARYSLSFYIGSSTPVLASHIPTTGLNKNRRARNLWVWNRGNGFVQIKCVHLSKPRASDFSDLIEPIVASR